MLTFYLLLIIISRQWYHLHSFPVTLVVSDHPSIIKLDFLKQNTLLADLLIYVDPFQFLVSSCLPVDQRVLWKKSSLWGLLLFRSVNNTVRGGTLCPNTYLWSRAGFGERWNKWLLVKCDLRVVSHCFLPSLPTAPPHNTWLKINEKSPN